MSDRGALESMVNSELAADQGKEWGKDIGGKGEGRLVWFRRGGSMQIQFADLWFGLQRIDSVSAGEGFILALLVEIRDT